jgi:hypothetical protein
MVMLRGVFSAARGHQRHRGKHRHGGLADGNDVDVFRANVADECFDVGHVVVEIELAQFHRHHARVDPVGDVDLVVVQQGAHGVAQQRGVVAGQRRHHQHDRVVLHLFDGGRIVAETLEAFELAERLVQRHAFDHGDFVIVRHGAGDAEFGFLVFLAQPVHQLVAGGDALRAAELAQRATVVVEHARVGLREVAQRTEKRTLPFMELIKHRRDRLDERNSPILARFALACCDAANPCDRRSETFPISDLARSALHQRRRLTVAAAQQQFVHTVCIA